MALRKYKPTSPGRRTMSVSSFEEITKTRPEKSLTEPLTKKGGRNNTGRITTRHQGGGHKRRYRVVDFKRVKDGVPAKVAAIEYDPNRSARIALLHYADGAKAYILAPARLRVGGDAAGAATVPGHGRSGREHRPREPDDRQGGSQPLARQASCGARLGDEPRRPPARRRRGQIEGRPAPRHA